MGLSPGSRTITISNPATVTQGSVSQFTRQQKLALALTSAGSQRALARQLDVSHQQVGRWLREGEPLHIDASGNMPTNKNGTLKVFGGAPDWIDSQLDWSFKQHLEIAQEQAFADGVPFNTMVPIYLERRYLSAQTGVFYPARRHATKEALRKYGSKWKDEHQIQYVYGFGYRVRQLGDRVISGPTEFIDAELRHLWLRGMVASNHFYKINIRSTVDLKNYFIKAAQDVLEERPQRRRKITVDDLAENIKESWIAKEALRNKIIDRIEPFPFYTESESAYEISPRLVADNIEDYLQRKHSPATGFPGTHFADEYLLQLLPSNYVPPNRKKPIGRSRKIIGGTKRRSK